MPSSSEIESTTSASPPPPKKSGRKGSRKVRTGCITCKIRKVKCDETKPFCLRCVKTGRKCDGYQPYPRPAGLVLSPGPGFDSPAQGRAFDYYRRHSVRVLAGSLDVGFWGDVVLRLSVAEPAVRHALLAVSSLHECVEARDRALDRRFAYLEYSKAITCLRSWSSNGEPSALPLLVCLLFVCFEFLADRQTASQMHICQGRKILSQLQAGRSPVLDLVRQSLIPIYTRLSLASFTFGSRPDPIPHHLNSWESVPAAFGTLDEARCMLYSLVDRGLQFNSQAVRAIFDPSASLQELEYLSAVQQHLLSELNRWNSAFTIFSCMDTNVQAQINARNLILVYYHASRVWVGTALQPGELKYDSHLHEFASMISLASAIVHCAPSSRPAFSFETELVAPIYWLVTKCRSPLLRRAALKLLMRDEIRGRRENHWHVDDVVAIAIRTIEVEEGGMDKALDGAIDPTDPLAGLDNFMKPDGNRPGVVRRQALNPEDLIIWSTQPPLIPGEEPIAAEPGSDNLSDTTSQNSFVFTSPPQKSRFSSSTRSDSPPPPFRIPRLQTSSLEAPFGIPEYRRVKNVTVGPKEARGVWATFFEDPRPGEQQWKITREFLARNQDGHISVWENMSPPKTFGINNSFKFLLES